MSQLLWMTGRAFLIALFLTPIIRDIFRSYNIVDRPTQRKVHVYPIPRVGGIPIAAAYGLALLYAGSSGPWTVYSPWAWKLIPGAALIFGIGLIDDFFNLNPLPKLFGQVTAATLVFFSGVRVESFAGRELPLWLAFPVTLFWLLLTSNALNLIDGLDGLCAGMGLLATLTLFAAAVLHGNHPLAYATLPMAGALLGFIVYNLNPATVFLGDSGALLIGFLLGCYGIIWTQKTSTLLSVLVPLLALSIPLLDVSLSVLRRFLRNQPIFGADRGHIHHRLLDRGLSARQAMWVLFLFASLAGVFALLATTSRNGRYQALATLLFCAVAWVGIRQLRYAEFDIAGRLLFRSDFHRAMDLKLRLANLETSLEKASNEELWWTTLVSGAEALDLAAVRWFGDHGERRALFETGPGPRWIFVVPVSEAESLELEGLASKPASGFDLLNFGETIRRTLLARRRIRVPVEKSAVVAP